MKAMKAASKPMKASRVAGKPLTKGGIASAIAEECELKSSIAGKMIGSLAAIAAKEVQKNGIFTFPGLCRIKTRNKPATKACKKEIQWRLREDVHGEGEAGTDDREGFPRGVLE